jgi:hypothetical protein
VAPVSAARAATWVHRSIVAVTRGTLPGAVC